MELMDHSDLLSPPLTLLEQQLATDDRDVAVPRLFSLVDESHARQVQGASSTKGDYITHCENCCENAQMDLL